MYPFNPMFNFDLGRLNIIPKIESLPGACVRTYSEVVNVQLAEPGLVLATVLVALAFCYVSFLLMKYDVI